MLLFWSLHFLSAFFHKVSSNVSRNMLKIQTESYFHLIVSKWPIPTPKLKDNEIFHGFWDFARNLATTWRNSFSCTSQKQRMFCHFFASSNVSSDLIHEALHRFNGWAKIWSAPGRWFLHANNALSTKNVYKTAETSNNFAPLRLKSYFSVKISLNRPISALTWLGQSIIPSHQSDNGTQVSWKGVLHEKWSFRRQESRESPWCGLAVCESEQFISSAASGQSTMPSHFCSTDMHRPSSPGHWYKSWSAVHVIEQLTSSEPSLQIKW